MPDTARTAPAPGLPDDRAASAVDDARLSPAALRRLALDSQERLARFMQASAEGIFFHENGVITDANPPLCALIDMPLEDIVGRAIPDFFAPEDAARIATAIEAGDEAAYESVLVDRRQHRVPVELIGRSMRRHGERLRMTIVRDIRARQAAEAHIRYLAHHDVLTGLPNREAFMARLEQAISNTRPADARVAVLFIDLDQFKRVNDSLGHLAGDALLCTVAERIVASLRAADIVARFGGDEFMVLLTGLPTSPTEPAVDAEEVGQKLLAAISAPFNAQGRMISVTPSIGIALFDREGLTPDQLVKNADSAMYRAKGRGRANVQFFDAAASGTALASLVLESQLAEALDRGEFQLHFQPQVGAVDGRVRGAEALIRWRHPERGLLGADAFIPLAEERQLMLPIGQWVLREAARCAVRWRAMGFGLGPVAVNLSSIQFQSIGFVEAVAAVLPGVGVEPGEGAGLIELELTERMLMDDLSEVKPRLARLKAMGLRISIDDFGTGYSSLAQLTQLPIDKLKIDRAFVRDLPADRKACAVIRAIIQLGQSLGMTVIAEGVETEAQRDFLAALGCDQLQGLLIGAPMPVAGFEAWLAANAPQVSAGCEDRRQ